MFSSIFGIILIAISLIPMISCFKKKPKKETVEPKPSPSPKTPTATVSAKTTTTADSKVQTPITGSRSGQSHLKPEPTQPSQKESQQLGPDMMEDFMNESFDDPIEDDTRDDAPSLKGVHLEIRSESFPLTKVKRLKKDGKEIERPRLMAKKSVEKVSLMKEDVTADDTDQSVREQKKKVTGILNRTQSVDRLKTKSRDEKTQSEKRHLQKTLQKMKTLATDREKARAKRRTTQLMRRRRSRIEKSKETEKSKEKEMDKSKERELETSKERKNEKTKDKSDDKSRDISDDKSKDHKVVPRKNREKPPAQSNVVSVDCYRGQ